MANEQKNINMHAMQLQLQLSRFRWIFLKQRISKTESSILIFLKSRTRDLLQFLMLFKNEVLIETRSLRDQV